MSAPRPNVNANPDTHVLPQMRNVYIEATFGPGAFDRADVSIGEHANYSSYATGRACGGSQITCDHGTGISFRIRPDTNFWPIMLGWKKHVRTGATIVTSDESEQLSYSSVAKTFPWVDNSGASATYRDNFRVWRIV